MKLCHILVEPPELSTMALHKHALMDARYIGDLQAEHFSTPRKAKRHLDFIRQKSDEDKKKIKILKMQKSRLLTRVSTLNSLLDHLKEEELISVNAYSCIQVYLKN